MLQTEATLQPAGVRQKAVLSSQPPKWQFGEQEKIRLYFKLYLAAFCTSLE